MTVYALEILPTGTVVEHGKPFGLEQAEALLGPIDLCTAPDRQHVLAVGEWSAVDQADEQNPLAWLAYGRSMLCGPVLLWRDDNRPLDAELIAFIEAARELLADPELMVRESAVAFSADFWMRRGRT